MNTVVLGILCGAAMLTMITLAYWMGFRSGVEQAQKTMEAMHQDHIETLKRVL